MSIHRQSEEINLDVPILLDIFLSQNPGYNMYIVDHVVENYIELVLQCGHFEKSIIVPAEKYFYMIMRDESWVELKQLLNEAKNTIESLKAEEEATQNNG